jgi:hypothetical protein
MATRVAGRPWANLSQTFNLLAKAPLEPSP